MSNIVDGFLAMRDERDSRKRQERQQAAMRLQELQVMRDSAAPGSVGAPGGLPRDLNNPYQGNQGENAVMGAMMAPGIGDILGPMYDMQNFIRNPESRTPVNYGLAAAGALPAIPSLMYLMNRKVGQSGLQKMFPGESGQVGYHGTPNEFAPTPGNPHGQFDSTKMGTGEGAQARGWGHYVAENPGVAGTYRDDLSQMTNAKEITDEWLEFIDSTGVSDPSELKRLMEESASHRSDWFTDEAAKNDDYIKALLTGDRKAALDASGKGLLYEVDIPDEDVAKMLDLDANYAEQPQSVKDAFESLDQEMMEDMFDEYGMNYNLEDMTGEELYQTIKKAGVNDILPPLEEEYTRALRTDERASMWLHSKGVPGSKFYDGQSRKAKEGTRNLVLFSDDLGKIIGKK